MPPDRCVRDPSLECFGSQRVDLLIKEIDEWKASAKASHQEMYDRIRKLENNDARRDEQYKQIIEKLDQLALDISGASDDLQDLKIKPAKRWEDVTRQVLLTVVAAVCAFFLDRLGL